MSKVIYVKNGTWWSFSGTLEEAQCIPDTYEHKLFSGALGPLTLAAQKRPNDFFTLPAKIQWDIDKKLGILDWNGEPTA